MTGEEARSSKVKQGQARSREAMEVKKAREEWWVRAGLAKQGASERGQGGRWSNGKEGEGREGGGQVRASGGGNRIQPIYRAVLRGEPDFFRSDG